jgi:hypothetical protein
MSLGGRAVLLADLDVSCIRLLSFGPVPVPPQQKSGKRRKSKAVPADRELVVWWHGPSGGRVRLQFQLGLCSPLASPAVVALELPAAKGIQPGEVLEFELRERETPGEPGTPAAQPRD